MKKMKLRATLVLLVVCAAWGTAGGNMTAFVRDDASKTGET